MNARFRFLLAALVAAFLPCVTLAADEIDAERMTEARALLNVMQIVRQLDNMSALMAETMAKQFAQGRSPGAVRTIQVMQEESFRAMKEEMDAPGGTLEMLAKAYGSQFTVAELRQIRTFYESPAGQRLLLSQPDVMNQALPRLMESTRAAYPRVCARAKARLTAEKIEGGEAMRCPPAP
jgi:uncharacterized protein